jgi:hypothetical protein
MIPILRSGWAIGDSIDVETNKINWPKMIAAIISLTIIEFIFWKAGVLVFGELK